MGGCGFAQCRFFVLSPVSRGKLGFAILLFPENRKSKAAYTHVLRCTQVLNRGAGLCFTQPVRSAATLQCCHAANDCLGPRPPSLLIPGGAACLLSSRVSFQPDPRSWGLLWSLISVDVIVCNFLP